jgi:cold shock CspA family protein
MTSRGCVRHYSVDEGWGIIDSDDTPGGCLVQSLSIGPGSGILSAGDEVEFEWEPLPAGVEEKQFRFSAPSVHKTQSDGSEPTVRVSDYPQLRLIAWSLRSDAIITEADALSLYERNWRHVEALDAREADFVQYLVKARGGGRRLV